VWQAVSISVVEFIAGERISIGFEVMLPSACSFIVDVSLSYI
jgi:hypothetical protein